MCFLRWIWEQIPGENGNGKITRIKEKAMDDKMWAMMEEHKRLCKERAAVQARIEALTREIAEYQNKTFENVYKLPQTNREMVF